MQIRQSVRRVGQTLGYCIEILPKLKEGKSVFIAGEKYPTNFVSILKNLGLEVHVKEGYTTQKLEPVYDNLFAIEPQIIGYTQEPKKLTGHRIKEKTK